MEDIIYSELTSLGLPGLDNLIIKEIRNKDGVYLYRITDRDKSYVLKYFHNEEYRREIKNYTILKELNIKTMEVLGSTDKSLLLEDLDISDDYRLGVAEDLSDTVVAKSLARWYIDLHNKGVEFVKNNKGSFYREIDEITRENIEFIKKKSNTESNKVWNLMLDNFDLIKDKINIPEETINYNDFYWTNLVVSKDKTEAFMFDYNFLGFGFRYNDIRNVCASLSEEAGRVFIEKYGGINKYEKVIDDAISHLINLIFSYKKSTFPYWGEESLAAVNNGELEKAIIRLLES